MKENISKELLSKVLKEWSEDEVLYSVRVDTSSLFIETNYGEDRFITSEFIEWIEDWIMLQDYYCVASGKNKIHENLDEYIHWHSIQKNKGDLPIYFEENTKLESAIKTFEYIYKRG